MDINNDNCLSYNLNWKSKSLFLYWDLPKNKSLTAIARKLRKSGVLSEVIFWEIFKNKDLLGWDIDRQVIIGNFIVDFFIPELGLIFEIDGSSHNFKYQYDLEREKFLNSLNLEIIQIADIDVKQNIDKVLHYILEKTKSRELHLKNGIKTSTPSASADTPQEGNKSNNDL